MSKVYIVSAKRTAIGSFMGSLSTVHPKVYGAEVVKTLLQDTQVPSDEIDEVIVGNILPAGLGQGLARQVSLTAGIPQSVPAYTLNMVCGSGMKTVMQASSLIRSNQAHCIIAGGVESMSKAPFILPDRLRQGHKMGGFEVKDHMIDDALTDAFEPIHMGITAENIAAKYQISREAQDQLAYQSQARAIKAQDEGRFKDEIVPITVAHRKGTFVFDADEYINRQSSYEKLASLRPAFKKDGSVTAGNSSGINDGASFMMLVSESFAQKHNLSPLAEIVGIGQAGVDPNYMGLGPVPAINKALKDAHLAFQDIDLFELNEAFAAQALGVLKGLEQEYGVDVDTMNAQTNVYGGSIALGHPVGASGNRIIVTLLHALKSQNKSLGLASLCIGGGMGTALIVRSLA